MTGQPRGFVTDSRATDSAGTVSRRCPETGARDCRSRRCDLHYTLAPLRFGPNRYAVDRFRFKAYDRVSVRFGTALLEIGSGVTAPDARRGLLILTGQPRTYARLRRALADTWQREQARRFAS